MKKLLAILAAVGLGLVTLAAPKLPTSTGGSSRCRTCPKKWGGPSNRLRRRHRLFFALRTI